MVLEWKEEDEKKEEGKQQKKRHRLFTKHLEHVCFCIDNGRFITKHKRNKFLLLRLMHKSSIDNAKTNISCLIVKSTTNFDIFIFNLFNRRRIE